MSKPMMIFRGPITKRIYAVTAYKDHGDGRFEATGKKHDITDQLHALMRELLLSNEAVEAIHKSYSEWIGIRHIDKGDAHHAITAALDAVATGGGDQ